MVTKSGTIIRRRQLPYKAAPEFATTTTGNEDTDADTEGDRGEQEAILSSDIQITSKKSGGCGEASGKPLKYCI